MRGILFAALLHVQELDGGCWKDMPWVLKNDMLKRCALQLWLSVYYFTKIGFLLLSDKELCFPSPPGTISLIVQENFKRIKRRNFPRCNMLNTTCNIDLLLNTRCINLYLHDLLCLCFCYTDKPRTTKINHDLLFGFIVRQWSCWELTVHYVAFRWQLCNGELSCKCIPLEWNCWTMGRKTWAF